MIPGFAAFKLKGLIGSIACCLTRLLHAPPGHFYSPIPSLREVRRRADRIFGPPPKTLPGIDLNESGQLDLLDRLAEYYPQHPYADESAADTRYRLDNPAYGPADAICLYGMIRHASPRRIIEVGSGYSSCVMLDTNERFFDDRIACTFIEPYPKVLLGLVREADRSRIRLIGKPVQDVPMDVFEELEEGDILFVDSSHVSKVGSDVNHLLFEVFPRLSKGVYVHVHDMLYPFEYSQKWIYRGIAWNEAYLLRSFLQYNGAFRIVLFNSFLEKFHRDRIAERMPLWLQSAGGSLWFRKEA